MACILSALARSAGARYGEGEGFIEPRSADGWRVRERMFMPLGGARRRIWGPSRMYRRDVAKERHLRELLSVIEPEIIFHLASEVTESRELERIADVPQHLHSTVTVLVEATKVGCERVVLTGSMEAAGTDREDAVPPSPYAAAKRASGEYARAFHAP